MVDEVRKELAEIIQEEVNFFNGWKVSDTIELSACYKAGDRILQKLDFWVDCKNRLPEKNVSVFLWCIYYAKGNLNNGELCIGYLNDQGYFQVTWTLGTPDILEPIVEVSHWAEWPKPPRAQQVAQRDLLPGG
jgi:hypothetical protein